MRFQQLSWSCGPAAVVNAARAVGKRIAESRVRKLSGTTKRDGTDEHGLITGIRGAGLTATPHWSTIDTTAWAFVRSNVLDGRPCLLCIDNWGHWVTAIGLVGDHVLIADPTSATINQNENGIHSFARRQLIKRWKHRLEEEPFYAIAVGR